jgi:glycosyltransferase involved in cell wall biosynthesis
LVGASHALEAACAAIIVKSEQMRQRLLLPSSRARAHVVPNGVDLRLFRPMPKAKALATLGLRPGPRYVLFPHTAFDHRKRIDLAQAAMDQLRARGRDTELLVVYHKPPEQMPAFYSASDVLLLTSDWEGSPNVVKEALACNLPVISVPVGDVEERIRGLAACRICPRDPAALAAAIDATLVQPRPDSLRLAVAELDAPRVANRLIEIYRGVLANA